jgi:hypothetical protein
MKTNKKLLQEDLNKFKSLLNYDEESGLVTEKVGPDRSAYRETINEADPEDEEQSKGEDEESGNPDFDFGDEGGSEESGSEEGGDEDFDFGDMEDELSDMEGGEEDVEQTDLGKEDEFSAADELEFEDDEEVEEIDVTEIINKSEEAKEMAQQAVASSQENGAYLQSLSDKFDNITNSLGAVDNILAKISKIESDIKTPEEKLELRSLDSYPFNVNLKDYWETKGDENDNYTITNGEEEGTRKYKIDLSDVSDYSDDQIKQSFNPSNNQ